MYPKDEKSPKGKLRFSFEAAPLAFIVENAGGKASTGIERILDIVPKGIHERLPLFIGSKNDVTMAENSSKVMAGQLEHNFNDPPWFRQKRYV